MTAQNPLDHQGTLEFHPLAELLVEVQQAKLDGSMRLFRADAKAIIYFRSGSVVFAASNSPEYRLVKVLSERSNTITEVIARLPKCSNEVELSAMLVREKVLKKVEIDAAIVKQIECIVGGALNWADGNWHFSPLVRPRSDLAYPVDMRSILVAYARSRPMARVMARFKSADEQLQKIAEAANLPGLQSHEEYVLQRFGDEPRSIQDLTFECGLPENGFLQAVYVLWLAGLLRRTGWNAAFSEPRLAAIRGARVEVVRQAQKAVVNETTAPETPVEVKPVEPAAAETELTLDEYLARVEGASTHYDALGIDLKATNAELKSSYLVLAKLFHPDRFHRHDRATLDRIQAAFSSVQAAYETLKTPDSRETYNLKVRKELETREKLRAQGVADTDETGIKAEQGLESFEVGLSLLMDEEFERAIPFLGRAAHYNPENALYRAYFGKALSYERKQIHRAEGEMQAAVKLDPQNPKIRLMLVEFFIDQNLPKRAEGELKRFLEIAPDNKEAQALLSKLQG